MPRALITTLYALPRREICTLTSCRPFNFGLTDDLIDRMAEWVGVDADVVEWTELEEGEFLTVAGEVVGFAETRFVELPEAPAHLYGALGRA
jgi:hypothetical protein